MLQPEPNPDVYPIIHLVRHGCVPDHMADQPLTDEGQQESLDFGRHLAAQIRPEEMINFFCGPSRRTRQTAALLKDGLSGALARGSVPVTIGPIVEVDPVFDSCRFFRGSK